eukprot:CAMPEP_0172893910 /NCGR_PEP_ID=MMETSP1075-20121228/149708_1 /TAXON_ID=2916 /ORGANISM="Ceratium fusus, Strain PA161109" /LENGTH=171 /DNA_ID=CAMNT_0013748843 /DNA_START=11 /DNA_END=523 /DNA_ORIENTATION=+
MPEEGAATQNVEPVTSKAFNSAPQSSEDHSTMTSMVVEMVKAATSMYSSASIGRASKMRVSTCTTDITRSPTGNMSTILCSVATKPGHVLDYLISPIQVLVCALEDAFQASSTDLLVTAEFCDSFDDLLKLVVVLALAPCKAMHTKQGSKTPHIKWHSIWAVGFTPAQIHH